MSLTETRRINPNMVTPVEQKPHVTAPYLPPGAQKFDGEKPRMELFPLTVAESISKVLTFGAQKYAAHGWKSLPKAVERYQGALLRHLSALQSGEEIDSDSGLPHIYHIGCNITFLIHFYNENQENFMKEIKAWRDL